MKEKSTTLHLPGASCLWGVRTSGFTSPPLGAPRPPGGLLISPAPAHSQSGGARDSYSVHWDAPYHTTPAGAARQPRSQARAGRSGKPSRKPPRQTGESALADHFLVVPLCTVCSPPIPPCLSPLLLISHLGVSSSKNCSPAPPLDSVLCKSM